ncbi:MAG: UDP-N-acetylmuramoyl-L-alanine--D-glutamate ligase [Planctomycetes bacterium]|nr:UDP-N-acetylmuramoyl-L-alanine--D-glutamate ligase [Planctomycetota bacterium]
MTALPGDGLPAPGSLVVVHGLGRFGGGREAVRFLARRGCRVRVADKSDGADLQAVRLALRDAGDVDWQLGREDASLLDGADWLLTNPAVPDQHPLLAAAAARGVARTQEVDLFLAAYPGTVVAVTGTNGKSTTSTLLHAALRRAGRDALLGGNIGNSLLAEQANWQRDQIAVLEISSFQLERLHAARRTAGAVFTRIGKDHVDRHGSLAAYHQAKARLAAIATDFVVHAADDPVASAYASPAQRRVRFAPTPPAPDCAGVDDGMVTVRLGAGPAVPIVHAAALRLLGEFQLENVMAAAAAARLVGADAHAVGLALANASPLPFRLQLVAVQDGVRVYDNGVSTEVESTRSALQALTGRIHWVGGGKSKDGDYATMAAAVAPRIASAHLFGAAAEPLGALLQDRVPTTVHGPLAAALTAAFAAARPGDAVLFSPAFASFDQYPNFRARALEFHGWLAARRDADASLGAGGAGT